MAASPPHRRRSPLKPLAAASAIALAATADATVNDTAFFRIEGLIVVWSADAAGSAPIVSDFIIDTGTGGTAATSGDVDLIASDAFTVVTGSLTSTQDALVTADVTQGIPFLVTNTDQGVINTDTNGDGVVSADDSFSSFGIGAASDASVDATETRTSFYVASNTPFNIDAQVDFPTSGLEFTLLLVTDLDMAVTLTGDDGLPFGSAAQFPHTDGALGGLNDVPSLFGLLGGETVFEGNQRTAAAPGTLAAQSVRFDQTYSIGAGALAGYDLSLGTFDFTVQVTYTAYAP